MERQGIIRLLNKDLEDEHGAIIQYLNHAYAIGEGEIACEIEAISRDEMRHLDWLAELIVELGGIPSVDRGKMLTGGANVPDWMKNNVQLEDGAISQYREHIEAIDDPKITRLLRRIVSDEESHHGTFMHFVDKTRREGVRDMRGAGGNKLARTLNESLRHEYTVVLQYLRHSYLTEGLDAKRKLEDRAINEMQHMGWIAEKLVDVSGSPELEHDEVDRSREIGDMLRADIETERAVAAGYDSASSEFAEADVRRLFRRMRDNEQYHAEVFEELLAPEGAPARASGDVDESSPAG